MALAVQRPKLTLSEKLYLPAIAAGLFITLKHFLNRLLGRTKSSLHRAIAQRTQETAAQDATAQGEET